MKKKIVPVGFFVLIVVLGALILFVTNKHSGTSAIPFVKVNDVIYVYDSTGYKVEELPETYSVIGEVIGNTASASKAQNGYASGLKVGEKIYQTSVKTDEVFVYTSLFSGDGTYRYVKFTSEQNKYRSFATNGAHKTVDYIAQDWIDTQFSGDAEVSDTIVLRSDNSGEVVGYIVSFTKQSVPAGYIVLSCEDGEHPIIEFALEGQSVYHYLEQQLDVINSAASSGMVSSDSNEFLSSATTFEENVLYTDFIRYAIKISNGTQSALLDQFAQITSCSELDVMTDTAPMSDTFFDDYIDLPNESGSKTVGNITGANDIRALVMGDMPNVTPGEGNCGPTSLANTVKLYAEFSLNDNGGSLSNLKVNDSDAETYERLVEISGYSCGNAASMSTLVSSIKSFAVERGYSCTTTNYLLDLWSDFKRDVTADKPILLYTSSSAGTAHAQVVVGFWEYTNGGKYVKILSGWTSYPTFLKFKPSSLNNFNGYCVAISD